MSSEQDPERPGGDERAMDEARSEDIPAPTSDESEFTDLFAMRPDTPPIATNAESEGFSDDAQPQTDSIRLIGEMFGGFRRKSPSSDKDLHILLGTATATLPQITGDRVVPQAEPADAVDTTQNDAPEDTVNQEPPAPSDSPEPAAGSTPPESPQALTIRTAYVPRSPDNQAERALAWLTAENVGTGQVPVISQVSDIVPRRRRWVGAIFAPILTAIVLAVAYVVAFAVWPLHNVGPDIASATLETPTGAPMSMPWPDQGYAAVAIEGIDGVVSSATEENPETPVPMASLTKVITALVLLERQPLAPGEDGPMYEFGWLDQQAANDLRWRNESALDVPVGGTLTYFQLLEGILMGSAGNYANKLVDQLWDYDRDAYGISVISWLERNGLENTVVVDATGISPDNRSTPSDMLRVSELALANPVIAEIVAQAETDIPGAGEVKNSHPLINETGIVGIKTGHLDTWESVSYNLTTAKDIDRGDDGVTRAYAAVMQQPNHDLQESISRDLLNAVVTGLEPIEALPGGTVVATVTAPWGAQTQVVTSQDAVLTLWNGEEATIDLGEFTVRVGDRADRSVGTATISGQLDETEVELRTTDAFTPPSIQWRLSHPLELLGIGG